MLRKVLQRHYATPFGPLLRCLLEYLAPLQLRRQRRAMSPLRRLAYPEGICSAEGGTSRSHITKEALPLSRRASRMGGRRPTFPRVVAVSSALPGLTSLFGMGRGAPRRHSRHVSLSGLWRMKEGTPLIRAKLPRPGLPRPDRRLHAQAFGQLVPLGSTSRNASTCGLSTWSSATAL